MEIGEYKAWVSPTAIEIARFGDDRRAPESDEFDTEMIRICRDYNPPDRVFEGGEKLVQYSD